MLENMPNPLNFPRSLALGKVSISTNTPKHTAKSFGGCFLLSVTGFSGVM